MWTPKQIGQTEYFVWGNNPRILIVSGMHGDEGETAYLLKKHLEGCYGELSDFVYIPFVSPSAIRQGTRLNGRGVDINRSFIPDTHDDEARAVMAIVKDFRFDLVLDFHEDRDRTSGFYMYDNEGRMDNETLTKFNSLVSELGLSMYNGLDDEEDPTLGLLIKDGYVAPHGCAEKVEMGFMSSWVIKMGVAPRQIDFEIPGKAKPKIKEKLVQGLLKLSISGV